MNPFIQFHDNTIVVDNSATAKTGFKRRRCDNCNKRRKGCDKGNPCSGCRHLGIKCTDSRGVNKPTPDTTEEKSAKRQRLYAESQAPEFSNNLEYEHDVICGWTSQQWTALFSRVSVIKELLMVSKDGSLKFPQNDNKTPLHWAAQNGLVAVVRLLLLEFQLDATAQDFSGSTPLQLAQERGHAEVVRLLKQFGTCVNSKSSNGNMPLHLTASNKYVEITRLPAQEFDANFNMVPSEKVPISEHPDAATSLNKLAQGKYDEVELYQQALATCEKILGLEHPDTAISLNNLAGIFESQGKYDEAEPLYQQALAIREKAFGPERQDTATSLNNMAWLYASQGNCDEAELYQQALAIHKVLGPEHPDKVTSLNSMAWLYASQGKYDEAEPLYQQALAIREKVLGPEHPDTAISLNNMAWLYASQGKYGEAEPLYQRVLTIYEKGLGHPDTTILLDNIVTLNLWKAYNPADMRYERRPGGG